MPSEAEVKCSNPKCGYVNTGQVCTKCGTLTPPQAEVVASSRDPKVPTASEASEIALKFINYFFKNPGRDKPRASIPADPLRDDDLRLMAFIRSVKPPPAQGKEKTCSDESQGGGTASPQNSKLSSSASPDASSATPPTASLPNPPAWATPNILAACGPGDELFLYVETQLVYRFPGELVWDEYTSRWVHSGITKGILAAWAHESYTIPTPPAAKCRCGGAFGAAFYTCENERFCSTCFHKYFERAKPEPKDGAEEVARKIVDVNHENGFASVKDGDGRYLLDFGDRHQRIGTFVQKLQAAITAAIRADREKQAARPKADSVSIGNAAINSIIAGSLFRISGQELDSNVIVWSANAAEQIGEAVNRIGEPS